MAASRRRGAAAPASRGAARGAGRGASRGARRGGGGGGGGSGREPHPGEEFARLTAALRLGLPSIVILRGEERWYQARAVRLLVDAAQAAGMEVCRHDAQDPDYNVGALMDDLSTGALFGGARCVVLQSAERVVVERASKASSAVREALLARVTARMEGLIVLAADKLIVTHALVKAAQEHGGLVIGCRRLWDSPPPWNPDPRLAEPVQWLVARARERKLDLAPDQAAYVVAATGNDLAALDEQLQRIVSSGGAALREVVGWEAGASPYDVAEHMLMGRAPRALAGIETLFRGGASQRDGTKVLDVASITIQLAAGLSAKLREALAGARAVAAGLDGRAAAAAAGVKGPPQAVQAFEQRLAARDAAAWAQMLDDLAQLERRSRTGAGADATDFAQLAVRWRAADVQRAPAARRTR
ncbi:MAG: hypothetical protein R3F49_16070 [Planctomycetota bacterium]